MDRFYNFISEFEKSHTDYISAPDSIFSIHNTNLEFSSSNSSGSSQIRRARIVAIEGLKGVGKSTLIESLVKCGGAESTTVSSVDAEQTFAHLLAGTC